MSTASSVKAHLSRKDYLTDKCSQSAKLVIAETTSIQPSYQELIKHEKYVSKLNIYKLMPRLMSYCSLLS